MTLTGRHLRCYPVHISCNAISENPISGSSLIASVLLWVLFGMCSLSWAESESDAHAEMFQLSEALSGLDVSMVKLGSVKAAVFEPTTGVMLYQKNANVQTPIASVTKLMTALVIIESGQSLDEYLTIEKIKTSFSKNGYSRLREGSELPRGDLLRLALMASENLAATNLGYHYPGGMSGFVDAMNAKAQSLGMLNTHFTEPSGLSVGNVSTAEDLVKLVVAATRHEIIRDYSTTTRYTAKFRSPRYSLYYGNTNRLVSSSNWEIELSKTGYLTEAGRCLVLSTDVQGSPVVMVFLDSFGKLTPIGDAGRIKRWINTGNGGTVAGAALNYERQKSAAIN